MRDDQAAISEFLDKVEIAVKQVRGYRAHDEKFGSAVDLIEEAFPALLALAKKTSASDEAFLVARSRGYGPWVDEMLSKLRGKLYGTCVHCGRRAGTHRATIYHTENCPTRSKGYEGPMS